MQSDVLKNYEPARPTQIEGGEAIYLRRQLAQISQSIALLNQVVKQIDARLVAHGI